MIHERAETLRQRFRKARLPLMEAQTHIVPLIIGDAVKTKQVSDCLLKQHSIYVQAINYPTVPKGTERLRFTPTPLHNDAHMDHLLEALQECWTTFDLPRVA